MNRDNEKTRVGLGRTKLAIPPFEVCFEIYKMGMVSESRRLERKNKTQVSDLVVERFRKKVEVELGRNVKQA